MALSLTDYSGNSNTLTNVGGTLYTTSLPFSPNNVNGVAITAGNYLTADDSASLSITGSLTISSWIRFTTIPHAGADSQAVVSKWNDTGSKCSWIYLVTYSGGVKFRFLYTTAGSYSADNDVWSGVWTPSTNTWYHIAVTFDAAGHSVQFYVDGAAFGAAGNTVGTSIYDSNAKLAIGSSNEGANSPLDNAQLDDIRIYNIKRTEAQIAGDKATRLSSFTNVVAYYPFDTPIDNVCGNDTYTKLLLHGNAADTSTTIKDDSAENHTVSCVAHAQQDTAQKKFGCSSILFDGTDDYLSSATSNDWKLGSGNFTIDCWVRYAVETGNQSIASLWSGAGNYAWEFYKIGNNLYFSYTSDGTNNTDLGPWALNPSADTWYHLALVRNGADVSCYVNGTRISIKDIGTATIFAGTGNFNVGCEKDGTSLFMNGWIDEFRLSKGVARWTGDTFTVPGTEYHSETATTNYLKQYRRTRFPGSITGI